MAMIVLDRFSQRLFVLPTRKTATGEMCAELFHDEITCRAVRGCPREVISDRDVRFTSNSKMKKLSGKVSNAGWVLVLDFRLLVLSRRMVQLNVRSR